MKLAILSDIHGNLPALQTVTEHVEEWNPDQVIVNGDVVNRGPLSRACWEFVQARGWTVLAGNHEEYVLNWRQRDAESTDIQQQFWRGSLWTFRQLAGQLDALALLPARLSLNDLMGGEVRLTHGSMKGNDDGIYPELNDNEIRQKISPPPAVFMTAHTHRPFQRKLGDTLVINSGSVGVPFDGDVRASYVQLTQSSDWQARIIRLPYDREQTRRDFSESGYLDGASPLTHIFLHEWDGASPTIRTFFRQYESAVLAGQITLGSAVEEYLRRVQPSFRLNA